MNKKKTLEECVDNNINYYSVKETDLFFVGNPFKNKDMKIFPKELVRPYNTGYIVLNEVHYIVGVFETKAEAEELRERLNTKRIQLEAHKKFLIEEIDRLTTIRPILYTTLDCISSSLFYRKRDGKKTSQYEMSKAYFKELYEENIDTLRRKKKLLADVKKSISDMIWDGGDEK